MSDNRCDLCGESLSLAEYRTGECMNCLEGIAPPASSDNSNELPDSFCFDSGREVDIFDDGSVMFREPNNSPAHYCAQDMQLYLNKEEMEAVIKSYQVLNATATSSDGRLIEALECAKYAIENPDSNQAFAIMAIDHALNTATSSDVMISRECAEKMFSILNNPVLNGKYLEDSDMRTPFFNELKAALEQSHE